MARSPSTPAGDTSFGFIVLTALFSGALVIAAVLAAKIIEIGPFFVPAGVLAYSLTFACTDIVAEVYGRDAARRLVVAGLVALVASLLLIRLALVWQPAPFWQGGAAFTAVLETSTRIIVASVLAYIVSQMFDVHLFHRLREMTDGRFLWLRNNGSTMASQLVDSAIFITVAFAGDLPVLPMILGQWVVKLAIAALDTPVVYAGVMLIQGRRPAAPAAGV